MAPHVDWWAVMEFAHFHPVRSTASILLGSLKLLWGCSRPEGAAGEVDGDRGGGHMTTLESVVGGNSG